MRNSKQVVLAAAIALASATAMADKGGGGGGHGGIGGAAGAGGMGSTSSGPANSANGAAHSGLPVGQGRTTADAAHQRNLDRAQDRLDDRKGVENGNEVELENRNRMENENALDRQDPNDVNDDTVHRRDRR